MAAECICFKYEVKYDVQYNNQVLPWNLGQKVMDKDLIFSYFYVPEQQLSVKYQMHLITDDVLWGHRHYHML